MCNCEPCSVPPARKLNELAEDMERVLFLMDTARYADDREPGDQVIARLVRKASSELAAMADRLPNERTP